MNKPIYEKDKAVSPIIATILIVAITVVLAATLYAVIGGYGGLIGKSTPSAGVQVTTSGTTTTVTINSVSGNLSLSDLKLQISAGGSSYTTGALASGTNYAPTGTAAPTTGFTITVNGGGGYLTGLSTITITPDGSPGTLSALKLVDTSTSGTVFSWPS